uniref:Uncharacterized protein n=1 Tax=Romanomermis culicivorax TaxID=13658 RepID=A0A915III2_ROMCU
MTNEEKYTIRNVRNEYGLPLRNPCLVRDTKMVEKVQCIGSPKDVAPIPMSGWFQGIQTLSTNLRSQASELAQEILGDDVDDDRGSTVGNEQPSDATISLLERKIESLNAEILNLQKANHDLFERATNAEKQIISPAKFEVESFDFPTTSSISAAEAPKINKFELKSLNDEIKELKAECSHWKCLVKCKEEDSNKEKVRFEHENEKLKYEVQNLRSQLDQALKISQDPSSSRNDADWENWNAESAVDEKKVDISDNSINIQMDSILQKNQSLTLECENLRKESSILSSNLRDKNQELDKRREELLEMSKAYEELNRDLEQEKSTNGQTSETNRQLAAKLDSLRGDIIEYEERYELCKRENEKAVSQLETFFEKFKNDLVDSRRADEASTEECKERLEHVTQELVQSLEKRDKLIVDVGKFENVVESFRQQLAEFRTQNQDLKRENEILKKALQEVGDVKQILEETDEQLTEINRTAKENELNRLKLELELRQEIDRLKEENSDLSKSIDLLRRPTTQIDDIKSINTAPGSKAPSCASSEEDFDETSKVTIKEKKGSGSGSPYMQIDVVKKQDFQCQTTENRTWDYSDATTNTDNSLDDETESLKLKNEELNSKVQSLLVENENNDQCIEDKDREIHHLNQLVIKMGQELEKDLKESESRSQSITEKLNSEISSLKNDREKLRRDLEILESKNSDLRIRSDALEAQNSEFKLKLDESASTQSFVDDEIESLKRNNEEFNSRVESLLLENKDKDQKIAHLNQLIVKMSQELEKNLKESESKSLENFVKLNSEVLSLKDQREKLRQDLGIWESENLDLRTRIDVLEALNFELKQTLSENLKYDGKIEQLNLELQQLRNENSGYCSKIQLLENRNFNLEPGLSGSTTCNEQYENLRNEYANELSNRKELELRLQNLDSQYKNLQIEYSNQDSNLRNLIDQKSELENENSSLKSQIELISREKNLSLALKIEQLESEKQQLIILVNEKHEESLKFYNEWQQSLLCKERSPSLSSEEMEKFKDEISSKNEQITLMETNFNRLSAENEKLKLNMNLVIQSKDRATSELYAERQRSDKLVEQVKVHEDSAQKATKELDRLKIHLVHIENSYTQELVKAEERESNLRQQLTKLEGQLINQSDFRQDQTYKNMLTIHFWLVLFRAMLIFSQKLKDQIVELSQSLEQALDQRDASLTQLSDVQLELEQRQKSVSNLQNVLLQFQKERDEKSYREIERFNKELQQLKLERATTTDKIHELEIEISKLREVESKSHDLEKLMSEKDLLINEMKHEELSLVYTRVLTTLEIETTAGGNVASEFGCL